MTKPTLVRTADSNPYASYDPEARKLAAWEMAREILAHNRQMAALAESLQLRISPYHEGHPLPPATGEDAEAMLDMAKLLIDLLADQLSDVRKQRRLVECIEAM